MILNKTKIYFLAVLLWVFPCLVASFKPARAYSLGFYYNRRYYSNDNTWLKKLNQLLKPQVGMLSQPPKIELEKQPVLSLPVVYDDRLKHLKEALDIAKVHSEELIKPDDKHVPYQKADT